MRNPVKVCTLLIALSLPCLAAVPAPSGHGLSTATGGKIFGLVLDNMGAKVSGASAILADSNGITVANTFSDGQGKFSFTGIAPGTYSLLSVKLINFQVWSGRATVVVSGNKPTKVTVVLAPTNIFP